MDRANDVIRRERVYELFNKRVGTAIGLGFKAHIKGYLGGIFFLQSPGGGHVAGKPPVQGRGEGPVQRAEGLLVAAPGAGDDAAGVAVDAVFDSVSVATTFKDQLEKAGVIFCSFSEAVRSHPELVERYLGTVVPPTDNFFAALNSAVFSDGSFVYIPEGVRCPMELSTYFRINAENTGQFERTLIIADKGSYVSYLEGCTAPARDIAQLHAAVVELVHVATLVHDDINDHSDLRRGRERSHTVVEHDDLVVDDPPLQLPRDDVLEYSFVLRPLAEIAPELVHPVTGRTMRDHWQECDAGRHPLVLEDVIL